MFDVYTLVFTNTKYKCNFNNFFMEKSCNQERGSTESINIFFFSLQDKKRIYIHQTDINLEWKDS